MPPDMFLSWEQIKDKYHRHIEAGQPVPDDYFADQGELISKTAASFARGMEAFYAPLKESQPLTWNALTKVCTAPVLATDKTYNRVIDFVSVVKEQVIRINPFNVGDDLRDWQNLYSLMPDFLRAYYENFNGLRAPFSNLPFHRNLPNNVSMWRRVNDYRKEERLPKKKVAKVEKLLGDLEYVTIFLETDWGDLALLNQNAKDQKIYVIPRGRFDDVFELNEPAVAIDKLCAHVLSGARESCRLGY
jgi:hypothetical protein